MRTGYLTALASRVLGAAPVLTPPTPSRFEPESPRAEWHETVQEGDPDPASGMASPGVVETPPGTQDRLIGGSNRDPILVLFTVADEADVSRLYLQ